MAHHILTLWALGATPELLVSHQQRNAQYQRPAFNVAISLVQDLEDASIFKKCLGQEVHFRTFEEFFLGQIKKYGYEDTIQKYLVGRSEVADAMHCHLYMGTYAQSGLCSPINNRR